MATIAPLYFVHGNRVVRGSLKKRLNQHRLLVAAETYVYADGSEQGIVLSFTRKLGHEEIVADPAPLLAMLPEPLPDFGQRSIPKEV